METLYSYYTHPYTSDAGRVEIIWDEANKDCYVWSVNRQQRLLPAPRRFDANGCAHPITTRDEAVAYAAAVKRRVEAETSGQ